MGKPISMIGEYGCDTARPRTMEPFVDATVGRHSTLLQLIDTRYSLSVLLSNVEISCRTQTALALAC